MTFSGGEPFCQPAALAALGERVKALGKSVMTYTGYTLEQLWERQDEGTRRLLAVTDILVGRALCGGGAGPDPPLPGSANQRLIDMDRTRAEGKIVLQDLEYG